MNGDTYGAVAVGRVVWTSGAFRIGEGSLDAYRLKVDTTRVVGRYGRLGGCVGLGFFDASELLRVPLREIGLISGRSIVSWRFACRTPATFFELAQAFLAHAPPCSGEETRVTHDA